MNERDVLEGMMRDKMSSSSDVRGVLSFISPDTKVVFAIRTKDRKGDVIAGHFRWIDGVIGRVGYSKGDLFSRWHEKQIELSEITLVFLFNEEMRVFVSRTSSERSSPVSRTSSSPLSPVSRTNSIGQMSSIIPSPTQSSTPILPRTIRGTLKR